MRLSTAAASIAVCLATTYAADYRISGPYTHSNLTIYLVHGQPPQEPGREKTYIPLDEALERKLAVVFETSDVNTLLIANISKDEIYLQSGDIVKGGKQDRVVKEDMILPPMSGKVAIAVFCVEHGRWTQRGNESAGQFESSKQSIAGNQMKLAVRADANQQEVWAKVAETQDRLAKSVGAPVQSAQSATSFQLTLESQKVRENSKAYEDAFAPLIGRYKDAVGYVVAVNGKVSSADIYASHALFAKLWPKLLASASVEAIGAGKPGLAAPAAPSYDEVRSIVAGGPKDAKSEPAMKVNSRTEVKRKESASGVAFETRDSSLAAGEAVHRSYVVK